jgi:hypothetical protein
VAAGAELALDALTCDDVSVQMLTGRIDARGELQDLTVIPMEASAGKTRGDTSSGHRGGRTRAGSAGTRYGYCQKTAMRLAPSGFR